MENNFSLNAILSKNTPMLACISGGTVGHILLKHMVLNGLVVKGFFLDYGQKSAVCELAAAQRQCDIIGGVPLTVIRLNLSVIDADIRSDTIAYKNMIIGSIATKVAMKLGCDSIIFGLYARQLGNLESFTDSFTFLEGINELISNDLSEGPLFYSPFHSQLKYEILEYGKGLDIDHGLSFSCTRPNIDMTACGCCSKCMERQTMFEAASINDLPFALRAGLMSMKQGGRAGIVFDEYDPSIPYDHRIR